MADCWHDSYEGAPTDGSARATGCDSEQAAVRGGSWDDHPRYLRVASRLSGYWPSARYYSLGFRLVQDLNP